jgi:hypothetical protein
MHRSLGWIASVALTGGALQFLVALAVSSDESDRWLVAGLVVFIGTAIVAGIGWAITRPRQEGQAQAPGGPLYDLEDSVLRAGETIDETGQPILRARRSFAWLDRVIRRRRND